ncbi:MAG: ATP-dependent Clp protease proteolytic subunit [Chitinispirillales bacterium]|jgi:membrane-bound serine protease (ClpP class)|nr:ATP-dependent Clp protease proteolytic subunit [Chitinispirillales bacterium]
MIKKFSFLFAFIVSAFAVFASDDTAALSSEVLDREKRTVVVIPVEGTVDHGMAAFISRSLNWAAQYDNPLVVLEIGTFGGLVDAAFSIADTVAACKLPTIAFVKSKAISAGALVALSANQLVMSENTTIGDVAPLINTNDGPKMLGEKFQSPLRAKFRTLAAKNGYPESLAEAMVTEEIAVYEVHLSDTVMYLDSAKLAALSSPQKKQIKETRLVVRSGELLTMTEAEAKRYGFSKMTVSNMDEMLQKMGYENFEIIRANESWSEKFVRVIAAISPILMMLGFAALYIETRSPGFGFGGILGIFCLALVFFGQYMVGLANYTELLFLAAGAVLLAVEVFVLPGFGIAGIGGILLMMTGMVLSFQSFVIPKPEFPWQYAVFMENILRVTVSILGSVLLIFIFFKYFFVRLSTVVKGPYLSATLEGTAADNAVGSVPHVGDRGKAVTPLRPSGKICVGNEECDVVTDGQFIDKGTEVIVSQIQGNRIVVGAAPCGRPQPMRLEMTGNDESPCI